MIIKNIFGFKILFYLIYVTLFLLLFKIQEREITYNYINSKNEVIIEVKNGNELFTKIIIVSLAGQTFFLTFKILDNLSKKFLQENGDIEDTKESSIKINQDIENTKESNSKINEEDDSNLEKVIQKPSIKKENNLLKNDIDYIYKLVLSSELLIIHGPSGSGKSTFLKILLYKYYQFYPGAQIYIVDLHDKSNEYPIFVNVIGKHKDFRKKMIDFLTFIKNLDYEAEQRFLNFSREEKDSPMIVIIEEFVEMYNLFLTEMNNKQKEILNNFVKCCFTKYRKAKIFIVFLLQSLKVSFLGMNNMGISNMFKQAPTISLNRRLTEDGFKSTGEATVTIAEELIGTIHFSITEIDALNNFNKENLIEKFEKLLDYDSPK